MNSIALPFHVAVSFKKLIKQYRDRLDHENNSLIKEYIQNILSYTDTYPELITGIDSKDRLDELKEPIALLLSDLFPQALTTNEIKTAVIPFHQQGIYSTDRLQKILSAAGDDYHLEFGDFDEDQLYVLACTVILTWYYKLNINYVKPLFFKIPDTQNKIRTYRVATNADFIEIDKLSDTKEISEEDKDELLNNFDNVDLWKEKFPMHSWSLKGFLILNLIDVTHDETISDLKTTLLALNPADSTTHDRFKSIFKELFVSDDINIGFTEYQSDDKYFLNPIKSDFYSYILNEDEQKCCEDALCTPTYDQLVIQHKNVIFTDVDLYHKKSKGNALATALQARGIKSCILAPIVYDGQLLGVLEIVSTVVKEFNTINSKRLEQVMPYIVLAVNKAKLDKENTIKAIIQNECTSIHPSVLWKFEEEAKRFMYAQLENKHHQFSDVAFDHVYPLFGQIDIKDSSQIRNHAIQSDLLYQLELVHDLFQSAYKIESIAFYEQMIFRVKEFINTIEVAFSTTSEESLLYFLKNEINPVMPHIKGLSIALAQKIEKYENSISVASGVVNTKRKNYEDTVALVNQKMAELIDIKQEAAQEVYPHFFERYKTDGVEHNIYIGESLTQAKTFSTLYLNNLRLWQLITMCEMENEFYDIQSATPIQLECASLILVFSNSLSIRYRIDEKKFDVDGAYNARYEIIKKRIDKAHIKGTTERITQKRKLVIVYSQNKDGLEYLRYIKYLQSINYLDDTIENIELEDLQGVVGLKAIRVGIMYGKQINGIEFDNIIKEMHA